jgi:hypothetical protein
MVRLEYKSLVTKEIIDHYLSIIKDEKVKKNLMNTASIFDIRISTKPVIKGASKFLSNIRQYIFRDTKKQDENILKINRLDK